MKLFPHAITSGMTPAVWLARACLGLACFTSAMPALAAADLPLFVNRPGAGIRITVADMEGELPWQGQELTVPKPAQARVPASRMSARPVPMKGGKTAIQLNWQEVWYAGLRFEAEQPVDLRPYLAQGTVEFDIKSPDLSRSGINLAMDCGPGCGRQINQVLASRALAGNGWQKLSVAIRCFDRDGADFSAVKRLFVLESSGTADVSVANVRLRVKGKPNLSCPDYRTESVTPRPQEEIWALDWWMTRHQKKLADIREAVAAGRPPQVVFIGDSITHGWEDVGKPVWDAHFARWNALGLGFGGDRTEHVLWRLQHGEIDGYQAKAVVLMIGTNNTGQRQEDPVTTAAGIRVILDEILSRQPQAKVLLLAVFPRDMQPDSRLRKLNEQLNQRLATLADERRVFFRNINSALMKADGTISKDILPDLLHLSEKGYGLWAAQITPTLERLMAP